MTRSHGFEQLLDAWLEEGPDVAPRQVIEIVLATAHTRRQQRRGFGVARRFRMFGAPLRAAAVAAAIVVGLVGLVIFTSGDRSKVVVSPPPSLPPQQTPAAVSPSAAASPSPLASPSALAGVVIQTGGSLSDGVIYTVPSFTPTFTFVGQADWRAEIADPSSTIITVEGAGRDGGSIQIMRPAGVRQPGAADGSVADPVPADLVAWLKGRSDVTFGKPTAITIGGIKGTRLVGSVKREAWNPDRQYITIACEDGFPYCNTAESGGLILISEPGNTNEVVVLSVSGQQLLIGLTASKDSWPGARPQLEAFLTGLRFPGAAGG